MEKKRFVILPAKCLGWMKGEVRGWCWGWGWRSEVGGKRRRGEGSAYYFGTR